MSRLMITGANGYLGSTLITQYLNDWEITAIDVSDLEYVAPRNCSFMKGSISDESFIVKALKEVDIVLHLAAVKGADNCRDNTINTIETNIIGTHKLIQSAVAHGVTRFIFGSTYWVYGKDADPPYSEKITTYPSELYGLSKIVSEQELIASGLDYTILRFSNIFGLGSGIRPQEVIFYFIKSAFEGKPLRLDGGGLQRLDFIDIEDVCRNIELVISDSTISNTIMNVGSGSPTSIKEVAVLVQEVFAREYGIDVGLNETKSQDVIIDRWLNIEQLKAVTGSEPRALKSSIENYAKDYKGRFL